MTFDAIISLSAEKSESKYWHLATDSRFRFLCRESRITIHSSLPYNKFPQQLNIQTWLIVLVRRRIQNLLGHLVSFLTCYDEGRKYFSYKGAGLWEVKGTSQLAVVNKSK